MSDNCLTIPSIQCGVFLVRCAGLLALGACGVPDAGDGPAKPAFILRDSAGIEIVENRRQNWTDDQAWRVDSVPLLRIGSQQGGAAYEFSDIAGAVALPDGGIAVADAGSGQVRFFDRAGEIGQIVGGRGRGPDEFTMLAGLGRGPSDRLWAYDFSLRRLSWIEPTDGSIEIVTLGPEPPVLTHVGPLSDGAFVLRQLWGATGVARATRAGVRRDSALVVVFDPVGALIDTIGAFPGREVVITIEGGRAVMTRRPFGTDLMAVARDTFVVVCEHQEPRFDEYSATGELRRSVVLPERDDRSLTDPDIEDFLEARLEDVPPEDRPAVRSNLASLPFPERKPAYGRLLVDDAGNVWAGEWTRDGEMAHRWSVIDPRGVWLGDVTLPDGFRLLSVTSDRLVGVERDELDTEYVVMYGLLLGET